MTLRPALPDGLLLECVVTTLNEDGAPHIRPMGPIVDQPITRALLRPYPPSQTLDNLERTGVAVMHSTDDVDLFARAALGQLDEAPPTKPTPDGRGVILLDACHWRQLSVESVDRSQAPALVDCVVVDEGRLRDFEGFNRARHAVIEATILATRIDYLPHEEILAQLVALESPVEKTAGNTELAAFARVKQYIHQRIGGRS